MKYIRSKLSRQLFAITLLIFCVVFLCLGFFLPKAMQPFYEKNLYNYLAKPLSYTEEELPSTSIDTEIAYLYRYDYRVVISDNFSKLIPINNVDEFLNNLENGTGKFTYLGKGYYYYKMDYGQVTKVALTDSSYITRMQKELRYILLPILIFTFIIVALILVGFSSILVRKITKLKNKIDHIDDDDFDHTVDDIKMDDEIKSLAVSIEDMRLSLKNQEEMRNQMYQNISHDFKTPLAVIKSYIEAIEDKAISEEEALKVIKEETDLLERKVHSLLYLNKLDYIKNVENLTFEEVDLESLLEKAIAKFKFQRKDVSFILEKDDKTKFIGTIDLWESVIDNLLGNFIRYAKKEIKITIKNHKLIFFNDGDNIDKDLLKVIFNPYRKGIKGEFGLGLSIIQKSLQVMGYTIQIKNHKNGVSFTISKEVRK